MASLLRHPFKGTRDVLAGYRAVGNNAVAVLQDMVFPDAPIPGPRVAGIIRRPVREVRPAMRKRRAILLAAPRPAASGNTALDAAASVVVTATAALSVDKPLAAAAAIAVTGTAALTVAKPLAASATVAVTATADLTAPGAGAALAASATVSVTASAALTVPKPLATAATVSVTAGTPSLDIPKPLAASGTVAITGAADLTTSGATVFRPHGVVRKRVRRDEPPGARRPRAIILASWRPLQGPALAASATVSITATAALLPPMAAAATISITATATLSGGTDATPRVGGVVRRPVRAPQPSRRRRAILRDARRISSGGAAVLAATATLSVSGTAALTVPKPLNAAATVVVTGAADLTSPTLGAALNASASVTITGTANLTVPKPLEAAALVTVTVAGRFSEVIELAAAAGFAITATATLTDIAVVTPISGVVTWRSDVAPAVAWNPRATALVAWEPVAAPATVWTSTLKRRYGRSRN